MTQKSTQIIDKNEDLVYTIKEVAGLLKVNKNYVYALINKGLLRSTKLGCRKVTRQALIEFLEKNDGLNFDEILATKPVKQGTYNTFVGNENHVGNPWEFIKSTVRKTVEMQYLWAFSKCGFKTRQGTEKALRVCSKDISFKEEKLYEKICMSLRICL